MKVVICTPVYGDLPSVYSICLANLLIRTFRERPDVELGYVQQTGHLIQTRNGVIKDAMERTPDHLLLIDSDMVFPPDGLIKLLAHNLSVVGCNYIKRRSPIETTAFKRVGKKFRQVHSTEESAAVGLVEPVDHMGLGFCLVSADIFRKLPERPFEAHANSVDYLCEDRFFFDSVRALGEDVYVDHALSRQIGHVGQLIYHHGLDQGAAT